MWSVVTTHERREYEWSRGWGTHPHPSFRVETNEPVTLETVFEDGEVDEAASIGSDWASLE